MGIARDDDGQVSGFFGYTGDDSLMDLSEAERVLWPDVAWLADGLDPAVARGNHPVIGPLDKLVDRWCERRELGPLSHVLSPYLTGPNGLRNWIRLLDALERVRDQADALPELPEEDLQVVLRLIDETTRIVRIGQEG